MNGAPPDSSRAFVLGLDGVPWRLIDRWTDAGRLPNFATLCEEGASGPLESTTPATTPLAWPSIATGVWPDKHGIYGFQKLTSSYSHRMYTSRDIAQPPIWSQIRPAAVGNVPMTYPPPAIDGAVVSGMMTPGTDREYTHPTSLAADVDDRIPEYQISLDYPSYADRLEAFEVAIDEVLDARRGLLDLLADVVPDWRLFFFVFTAPDRFQHLVWEDSKLRAHYERLDEILGDVFELVADEPTDLYVVSDHGFGPIETLVYGNVILEEAGYLTRREDEGTRGALSSLGISRDSVLGALNAVGISDDRLVDVLPRRVVDSVAERIPGDHSLYDVDYEETTAFLHDAGNLYVNDSARFDHGTVDPADVPEVIDDLVSLFDSVRDPETGDRILEIHDGEDLFPTDESSPDLVVTAVDGYEIRKTMADERFGDPHPTVASHESAGIVLCHGPSFAAGQHLRGARVVDVAPTLLHSLGEPVPQRADGRVLFDAYRDDATASRRKVDRVRLSVREATDEVDDDFAAVEDRLKGLGYME